MDTDDAFAFYVGLRYEIILQFHCICVYSYDMRWNLDTVTQNAMQEWQYGSKMFGFFADNKCPKMCFKMELEPSKLVSKTVTLCSISLIFCVKKYAVVLAHKATENLKWELGY